MTRNYYDAMQSTTPLENGYVGMRTNDYWVQLRPSGPSGDGAWKFRVSVAAQDVGRAWNIVADLLINDHGHHHTAKVISQDKKDVIDDPHAKQRGKMITLYSNSQTDPAHYMALYRELERRLREANICPGLSVHGDRPIPGSTYMSYRNDKAVDGDYNSADQTRNLLAHLRYNPSQLSDPYAHFTMPPDGQNMGYPKLGAWQPAETQNGNIVVRIAVNQQDIPAAMRVLQGYGLSPTVHESASMGTTLRLSGQDAIAVLKEQQHFFRTLRTDEWENGSIGNGQRVTRIAVKNPAEANDIMAQLQRQGLSPRLHESASMGMTVRLTGDECAFMDAMRLQSEQAQNQRKFYNYAHQAADSTPAQKFTQPALVTAPATPRF